MKLFQGKWQKPQALAEYLGEEKDTIKVELLQLNAEFIL